MRGKRDSEVEEGGEKDEDRGGGGGTETDNQTVCPLCDRCCSLRSRQDYIDTYANRGGVLVN